MTEASMRAPEEPADPSPVPASGPAEPATDSAAAMLALEQEARPREELNLLLIGFATGLMIGGFFLIYVVIAFTGLGR